MLFAISSPITWGFPAVSAILGFVHALERKLKLDTNYDHLSFGGTGILCHNFSPQVFRSNKISDAVFCLTRKPLDKDEKPVAFVEED